MICLICGHKTNKFGFGDKRSHVKGCPMVYTIKAVLIIDCPKKLINIKPVLDKPT
jgi:hypothetical protein